ALPCDVSDLAQVRELVQRQEQVRVPHILINNAGFATYNPVEQSSAEEITSLIGVNLLGSMYCTREFLPGMIARRGGRIVNSSWGLPRGRSASRPEPPAGSSPGSTGPASPRSTTGSPHDGGRRDAGLQDLRAPGGAPLLCQGTCVVLPLPGLRHAVPAPPSASR